MLLWREPRESLILDVSCDRVSQVANWRNAYFAAWLQKQPGLRDRVAIVEAFDAFAGRADLHPPRDCTHYIYSPFAWRYVWEDIARHVTNTSV